MSCGPSIWVSAVQLFTTIGLGCIALWFTRQQIAVARSKLRLDHFEKRFAVFEATRTFLESVRMSPDEIDYKHVQAFELGKQGASFLFDDEMLEYLEGILTRAAELPLLRQDVKNAQTPEIRGEMLARYNAEREWLWLQGVQLDRKFKPFLKVEG